MSEVHIDPRTYRTWVGYMHDCCEGCPNEYDNSHSKNSERLDKCLDCIANKLEPAYRSRNPFIFERETGKIKIESNIEKTK